jgi:hypothetical protein
MNLRPDRTGNPFSGTCSGGASTHTRTCWFNPGAFSTPPLYTFGNTSRNSLRGPGYFDADWGLHKNFTITEKMKLQFSWDVINAFNHVNLQNPHNNLNDGQVAQITDVVGATADTNGMRTQQLGLRLTW